VCPSVCEIGVVTVQSCEGAFRYAGWHGLTGVHHPQLGLRRCRPVTLRRDRAAGTHPRRDHVVPPV